MNRNLLSLLAPLYFMVLALSVTAAEPIKISIVAFGGKVSIVNAANTPITPKKGAAIPAGSTISTGPNSWIDLAQGGLSAMRVKAKTQKFQIIESSFDLATKKSTSRFQLRKGAVFVRVNKKAMTKGAKYQIQMPELIAGVIGSEGEMVDGPQGCTVMCSKGSFTGNGQPIPPGSMMVDPLGVSGPQTSPIPDNVMAALNASGDSMPTPTGGAISGGVDGGTAVGATPDASGIGSAATGGDPNGGTSSAGSTTESSDASTTTDTSTSGAESTPTSTASSPSP